MIINFSVQNFGCIKDKVTLSFEADSSKDLEDYYVVEPKKGLRLLKLGLIYGPNASGKTTILKALAFLISLSTKPSEKKTDLLTFKPFLFDDKTRMMNTFFSLEFIQNKIKYLYEIELNINAIISEKLYFFKPNKALVFKRKTDESLQTATIKFGSKIRIGKNQRVILEGNTLWNNTVLGGYLKTNFESRELRETSEWFVSFLPVNNLQQQWSNLAAFLSRVDNAAKKTILSILQKADFNIIDIELENKTDPENKDIDLDFLPSYSKKDPRLVFLFNELLKTNSSEIKFTHKLNNGGLFSLSLDEESGGTKKYFAYGLLLHYLIHFNKITSIDEIESSLHPDLLEHFILTFLMNAKHSQIIATTHYRELLMKKEILRHDIIWFTEKKSNGGIDLFSLSDFDSSVVRNTTSIYNAYKIGKLGANPNLKDHYLETINGKE